MRDYLVPPSSVCLQALTFVLREPSGGFGDCGGGDEGAHVDDDIHSRFGLTVRGNTKSTAVPPALSPTEDLPAAVRFAVRLCTDSIFRVRLQATNRRGDRDDIDNKRGRMVRIS